MHFKGHLKNVNLKPKGVKEIVIQITGDGLDGKLDDLSKMIDQDVEVSFDSLTVIYKHLVDAATNEPVHDYRFDNKGAYEQIELFDPLDSVEEEEEISREVIDEFILDGMGPDYDDLPKHLPMYIRRKIEGDSYHKLASELNVTVQGLITLMDNYRERVAPLALAYKKWKDEGKK